MPKVSVSKTLVSREFSLDEQIRLIKGILRSRDEQEAAKSLELNNASNFIELLDKALKSGRLDGKDRPTCVRYLARVCGWHGLLPVSMQVSSHQPEPEPHSAGGQSTVWLGRYNGQKIIIKKLNLYAGDSDSRKKKLIKVSYLFTVHQRHCIDLDLPCRRFARK